MSSSHSTPNDLLHESSPYLLQHAYNPVQWMPWGEVAWSRAKSENKPVIVSIGYAACHWCHVMERESFEQEAVAAVMNQHYICIKVDREERPDIDQIYMDAVQIVTGRGGWPLHALCLPDGRPFYAGTYFQREHWVQLLTYFAQHYHGNKQEILDHAEDITRGIKALDKVPEAVPSAFKEADLDTMFVNMDKHHDYTYGGRQGAPKFPMPATLHWWMDYAFHSGSQKAKEAFTTTLDNMAAGGIYDQVGGGFARYSVDAEWTIPHFEKMLYDNAQLVSVYSDAYRYTGNEVYAEIVRETLAFIHRELMGEGGYFYSALDADSEGEEGKYYVWSYEVLERQLGTFIEVFQHHFDISLEGNYEHGTNHLRYQSKRIPLSDHIQHCLHKLKRVRDQRVPPSTDDKSITAWNAMMIKGYIDAYTALHDITYLQQATQSMDHLLTHCMDDRHRLRRIYKDGKVSINGFLDDYAFSIEALISLYQATGIERWLKEAKALTDYSMQYFYSPASGIYCYTSILDEPLIARKTETSDNVIPSSNAIMARNLYVLGLLFDDVHYHTTATSMIAAMREYSVEHTYFYAAWARLSQWMVREPYQVMIVGADAQMMKMEFDRYYLPNCIFILTDKESTLPILLGKEIMPQSQIYICRDSTCSPPVHSVRAALIQLCVSID